MSTTRSPHAEKPRVRGWRVVASTGSFQLGADNRKIGARFCGGESGANANSRGTGAQTRSLTMLKAEQLAILLLFCAVL